MSKHREMHRLKNELRAAEEDSLFRVFDTAFKIIGEIQSKSPPNFIILKFLFFVISKPPSR